MKKQDAHIGIRKLIGLPSSFIAADCITHALNATKRPAAAKPQFGQKSDSMKKRCYADLAAINWPSRNTWTARRHARHAAAASIPAAACISIFISHEYCFKGKKKSVSCFFQQLSLLST